jgi:HSP20 family molecular chaperone IbpA
MSSRHGDATAHTQGDLHSKDFCPYREGWEPRNDGASTGPKRITRDGAKGETCQCAIQEARMADKSTDRERSTRQLIAGSTTVGAAVFLMICAVVTVLLGISALVDDKVLIVVPDRYSYRLNTTAWGWIHIILGVVVGAVAIGLLRSAVWARVCAIIIASLSMVSMFMWLPYSPILSIVVIALDIFVIWGVATWENPRARSTGKALESVNGGLLGQPQSRPLRPPLSDWFAGFPSWATLPPMFGGQPIRLEDEMKDGCYEVRAELPGIDPARDLDITARDGVLTIKAERRIETESDGRSEFAYGSFLRSVQLPPGANEDDVGATYDKGILTVTVGLSDAEGRAHKRIPVAHGT